MSTVQSLIDASLRLIGAIESGESPSSDESNDALEALNAMLASWYEEGIYIPSRTRESFTLSSSKESYTVGTGGDINTSWPMVIETAYWRRDNIDYPMDFMEEREYSVISNKRVTSRPSRFYYEPSFPLGAIFFDYLPDITYQLNLVSLKPLSNLSLSDSINMPGGFDRAIKFNLAVEIAPEYGATPSAAVISGAIESRRAIETRMVQSRVPELKTELSPRGRYNIYAE